MSCLNCEPLYCRSCLVNLKTQTCPTCNLPKNFNPAHLKLKNLLKELLVKGCPAKDCDRKNIPITYEALTKHLTTECKKIKGKCAKNCGQTLLRNEIDKHMENCPKILELEA